jgi:CRP-like cAMP-binding protein
MMGRLDRAQLRELDRLNADVMFGESTVIFGEGDPGDRMFVIRSGHVRVSRRSVDGRDFLMAVLGPGDVLGELAVFDPGPRTSTATALTRVIATVVPRSHLRRVIAEDPRWAWLLLERLTERLDNVESQLVSFASTGVAGRIAGQLVHLASRFDTRSDGTVHIACGLRSEDLTQLAGAGHTSGADALAAFVANGWITLDEHGVTVRDLGALRRCARQNDAQIAVHRPA